MSCDTSYNSRPSTHKSRVRATPEQAWSMDRQKKSFDFRMSKKVAELTQVVHMLFTRNHEKEVEMEAMRDAYEYEIQRVIDDAKGRIASLEEEIGGLTSRDKQEENRRYYQLLEEEMRKREEEWGRRVKEAETALGEERAECRHLRDLLINAQKDIEKLRQGVTEQLTFKTEEITRREKETAQLKKQIAALEKAMKDAEKEAKDEIRSLEKSLDKLQGEVNQTQALLDDSQRSREHLASKNKQLELEMKNLKRDFNRRMSEVVSSQLGKISRSAPTFTDYNEELERLKREVQRYRLELSNRDLNFNRMFTDQQPMVVDARGASRAGEKFHPSAVQGSLFVQHSHPPHTSPSIPHTSPSVAREKTIAHIYGPADDHHCSHNHSCRPTSANGHLPCISSPDSKSRLGKLAKPKPLPKEVLYGK